MLILRQLKLKDFDLSWPVDFLVLHAIKVTVVGLQQFLLEVLQCLRFAEFTVALGDHPSRLLSKVDQLVVL